MSDLTIYGATFSPFVRKAVVFASEKGLDVESAPCSPRDIPDELKPHTPLGKIPFARVGDRWLADSSVICRYVEDLWPNPALYPADRWERARANWIEEYCDGGLIPKNGPAIVGQRIVRPLLLGQPTDEAVVQNAVENDLPPMLRYLDDYLSEREWFAGDAFSIADITVASFQVTLKHADVEADPALYPNLVRHRDAVWARASFAALIRMEQAFLKQLKANAAPAATPAHA